MEPPIGSQSLYSAQCRECAALSRSRPGSGLASRWTLYSLHIWFYCKRKHSRVADGIHVFKDGNRGCLLRCNTLGSGGLASLSSRGYHTCINLGDAEAIPSSCCFYTMKTYFTEKKEG